MNLCVFLYYNINQTYTNIIFAINKYQLYQLPPLSYRSLW